MDSRHRVQADVRKQSRFSGRLFWAFDELAPATGTCSHAAGAHVDRRTASAKNLPGRVGRPDWIKPLDLIRALARCREQNTLLFAHGCGGGAGWRVDRGGFEFRGIEDPGSGGRSIGERVLFGSVFCRWLG